MLLRWKLVLVLLSALFASSAVKSADWIHWRGPSQNGHSLEKGLPESFDPEKGAKGNVLWSAPFGGRSAPLVMDGRVYMLQGTGGSLGLHEGEQVVCVDEKTGKPLWTYRVNVFLTDIVSARLGWIPLTADPATGYVYAHTTGGHLLCLDKAGKPVWQRSLTEEFGRVTGYGGRIPGPIFDTESGLLIVPFICSSWGDLAPTATRFVAFDGKTGQVVWWYNAGKPIKDTFCSNPVIAVINGQRQILCGSADGSIYSLKTRTGEFLWSYQFCKAAVNGAPIVDGNLVYCNHGDENVEGKFRGRIVCVDASQIDGVTKKPKLVWDSYNRPYKGNRNQPLNVPFGAASMALAEGRLYAPDDQGVLYCFDAKKGELLWKYKYATEVRGSPLVADGKLYIFDVKARALILTLKGNTQPDELETFEYAFREEKVQYAETNGTPIAVNGHVYFNSGGALYCIGKPDTKPADVKYPAAPAETKFDPNAAPAAVRIFPADVVGRSNDKFTFKVVLMDANGRELPAKDVKAEWSLPTPPIPKGQTAAPPPIQGTLENGTLTVGPQPTQQGYVAVKVGNLTARARVRVAAVLPYTQDFEKVPVGVAPSGWINANIKFRVVEKDGQKVLMKENTIAAPPVAKANAYITLPDSSGYTVQVDLRGDPARGTLADMGVVNSRYSLVLDGKIDPDTKKKTVRLASWEARPRINRGVEFDWQPGTWYTAKLVVEQKEKSAVIRGKVWKKGEKEPEAWTIEFEDPSPNRNGAAGLYGYVSNVGEGEPGAEIYYDNLIITSDSKK